MLSIFDWSSDWKHSVSEPYTSVSVIHDMFHSESAASNDPHMCHHVPVDPMCIYILLYIPWQSKTKQRIVFKMMMKGLPTTNRQILFLELPGCVYINTYKYECIWAYVWNYNELLIRSLSTYPAIHIQSVWIQPDIPACIWYFGLSCMQICWRQPPKR